MRPRSSVFTLAGVAGMFLLFGVATRPGMARQQVPTPRAAFAEPGISPDAREIAFTSGGDIWSVPSVGGEARLLVAHEANDRRPLFSPDGTRLAFVSSRTGGGDIYVLTFATGQLTRLTWDDGLEQLDSWSSDSTWVYFSSTSRDVGGMNDIYRVRATGGTPLPVSDERYTNEFAAAPSPDGRRLALAARGIASAQWWRRGSSHIDESEIWLLDLQDTDGRYTRISPRGARQHWPMWSRDGQTLFYVSDRNGAENIWARPVTADPQGTRRDRTVTTFTDGRVLWPSLSADGSTIAFERGFSIWTLETATGRARAVPITRRGAATQPVPVRLRQSADFDEFALSPDGRKVAIVARGEVFAASARDGGEATRATTSAGIEASPVWAPDSRRLIYTASKGDGTQLILYDFGTNTERPLTNATHMDIAPAVSPDGRRVSFIRDWRELHVLTIDGGDDRVLATGPFAESLGAATPMWSPDGQWLALLVIGAKRFTNVALVPTSGPPAAPRPVSFLANAFANSIAWSRDGSYLLFDTRQRTEAGQLARVDLTLRAPRLREDLFRDLFTAPARPADAGTPAAAAPPVAAPAASSPPVTPVFDDIRRRLSFVPTGLDITEVTLSPDGKTAILIGVAGGQQHLYAYSLDELAAERPVARQLTTTPSAKSSPFVTPDNREVYFLDGGRLAVANIEQRTSRPLNVTAAMTVDFSTEKITVFEQAWRLLRDNFFDAGFNGVRWDASREVYGERVAAAGTPDEVRRIISLMVGDLNASHLGITGPADTTPAIGRLGLRFDRRTYEASGRLTITEVIPLSPAALTREIAAGDELLAIDGRPIGGRDNLDARLEHTVDRRVVLTLRAAAGGPRDVVVRPIAQAAEKGLIYREWVERNRAYVLRASGGRLGYVHMLNMTAAALDQLHIDLDAENHELAGVVVDVRNNTGGFVNAYALDVFARQPYLRMSTRLVPDAPARTVLGQRALESPTVLVTNQHSLSDAEDFTEGYRALKLGPVIGEPTAGWIIYTWDARLVDGSTLRLPRMRVRDAAGADMERHPRRVDVAVDRPLGETATGRDTQLDAAVRELTRRLPPPVAGQ